MVVIDGSDKKEGVYAVLRTLIRYLPTANEKFICLCFLSLNVNHEYKALIFYLNCVAAQKTLEK